jgi:hypothetical protein
VPANLLLSTLTTNATGFVSTIALNGVSSINGAIYPPAAGSVPANLLVSTLGVSSLVTAPNINTTDLNAGTVTNLSSIQFAPENVYAGDASILMNGAYLPNNNWGTINFGTKNGEQKIMTFENIQNNVTTGNHDTYLFVGFDKAFLTASTPQGTCSLYTSGSMMGARGGPFSVSTLIDVSSINGAVYPPAAGSVPANLTVSSLLVNGILPDAITVAQGSSAGFSGAILFNSGGQDNVAAGQLAMNKANMNSVSKPANAFGMTISAYSTILGSYQPLGVSDMYIYSIENDGTNLAYMIESKNTPVSSLNLQAPNVNISSLIGVSSINGINWAAISTLVAAGP